MPTRLERHVTRSLAYLIAQVDAGSITKADAKRLGLTRSALSKSIGISARSLGRYLSGERSWPDSVLNRADDLVNSIFDTLELRRRIEQSDDEIPLDRPSIPVRVTRYGREQRAFGNELRSGIIEVDTVGLDGQEIADLLRFYWKELAKFNVEWQVRFLVNIDTSVYFGETDTLPAASPAKLTRLHAYGRDQMPMLIPRTPILFVPRVEDRTGGPRPANAQQALEHVRGELIDYSRNYVNRIRVQDGFLKITFVPVRSKDQSLPKKRFSKRRGKR